MSSGADCKDLDKDLLVLHALRSLPAGEAASVEAHACRCANCRQELQRLRSTVDAFVAWPVDVLRPPASLWNRLAARIAAETGQEPLAEPAEREPADPPWERPAPGIECKRLATDAQNHRVSMLVRLAPGVDYPPHRHAGIEELYLLDGELLIDGRQLSPGDYNRAEPGTIDRRVWSRTGCTCLLITSTQDVLGAS